MSEHPGRLAAIGVVLLGVGTALGELLTHMGARATGELRLDQLIATDREAPLVTAAQMINVGLGTTAAPVLLLVVCGVVAVKHRWAALMLGAATIVGWFSVALGKVAFARPRPPIGQVHALVRETGLDSYPSGHTAFAAALVAGVVLALRVSGRSTWWAWVFGVPFVTVVAVSRLYLGAHYLGDVLGSALYVAGTVLISSAVLSAVLTWWVRPRRRGPMTELPPRRGDQCPS